jgi:hypothetical protein
MLPKTPVLPFWASAYVGGKQSGQLCLAGCQTLHVPVSLPARRARSPAGGGPAPRSRLPNPKLMASRCRHATSQLRSASRLRSTRSVSSLPSPVEFGGRRHSRVLNSKRKQVNLLPPRRSGKERFSSGRSD